MLCRTDIKIQHVNTSEQALDCFQITADRLGVVGAEEKLHGGHGGGTHLAVMLLKLLPYRLRLILRDTGGYSGRANRARR